MVLVNRENEQTTIVNFSENINKLNVIIADKVKLELNNLLDSGHNNIIVDLSTITFIDSSGFGALVTVFNHARNVQARLLLANISNETKELIKITKLDQVFDIYNSVGEAKASII